MTIDDTANSWSNADATTYGAANNGTFALAGKTGGQHEVYIKPIAQVTPTNVRVYAGESTTALTSGDWVVVDTELTFAPTKGDYVVNGTVGADISDGIKMPAAGLRPAGAYKVALSDVKVTIGGKDYTETLYVADGTAIAAAAVATGAGTNVINKVGNTQFAATPYAAAAAVTTDLNLVAAIKITGTASTTVTYKSESTGADVPVISKSATPVYVEVGTELTAVSDTGIIKVTGDTADNLKLVIDGGTAKFTTTNEDLTLADA